MKLVVAIINVALLTAQALFYGAIGYIAVNEALDRREVAVLRDVCKAELKAAVPDSQASLVAVECRQMIR